MRPWISDGRSGYTIQKRFLFFFWCRLHFDYLGARGYSFSKDKEFMEEYCKGLNDGTKKELKEEIKKFRERMS
jgi:hypothetical protein